MTKFYKDIENGLKDIIAHKQGKLNLHTIEIEIPKPPVKYRAQDIARIRKRFHYSQGLFSRILNVSVKTVQSWESGHRAPTHSALRLLELVDREIYKPDILKTKS